MGMAGMVVEAWALVPDSMTHKEFHDHLVDIGNEVMEFNSDMGPKGAYKIAVMTPQED